MAVSPRNAVNSREVRTNGLELPILSDPGNEVAAAFGLRFTLPAYRIKQYRKLKNDLPTPRARVVGARGDELFGGQVLQDGLEFQPTPAP